MLSAQFFERITLLLVFTSGGLDGQTIRLDPDIDDIAVGVDRVK
jgi:hypothetical protein